MYAQVEKAKENRSRAVANSISQNKSNTKQGFGFENNRHGLTSNSNQQFVAIEEGQNKPQQIDVGKVSVVQQKILGFKKDENEKEEITTNDLTAIWSQSLENYIERPQEWGGDEQKKNDALTFVRSLNNDEFSKTKWDQFLKLWNAIKKSDETYTMPEALTALLVEVKEREKLGGTKEKAESDDRKGIVDKLDKIKESIGKLGTETDVALDELSKEIDGIEGLGEVSRLITAVIKERELAKDFNDVQRGDNARNNIIKFFAQKGVSEMFGGTVSIISSGVGAAAGAKTGALVTASLGGLDFGTSIVIGAYLGHKASQEISNRIEKAFADVIDTSQWGPTGDPGANYPKEILLEQRVQAYSRVI